MSEKHRALIERFASYVEEENLEGLPGLFHEEGMYNDTVYGIFRGREGIAAMFPLWYTLAGDFCWRFFDFMVDEERGYARSYFSYVSKHKASSGKRIELLMMSFFTFRDGLILSYEEACNPATAMVQMGIPDATFCKQLTLRATVEQNDIDEAKQRLGLA